MAECFWDHDRMIGVTEDCEEGGGPGGPGLGVLTLVSTRKGGSYDAHEVSFGSVEYPDITPPAGPAGAIVVTGYFDVDPGDYIPTDVYGGLTGFVVELPEGSVDLLETLSDPTAVTETAFVWDAGNDRWTLTVDAAFISANISVGLFVVVVDDVEHVAWLEFGAVG